MIHQRAETFVSLDDRPNRNTIIEKDEILSLIIDVEILPTEKFYEKYFSTNQG